MLINFWATWCGPCKVETPWLIELRNKYAGQGSGGPWPDSATLAGDARFMALALQG